jgi:WD40 repeat protein
MGVVYKARQLGLNRLVAVKMMLTGGTRDGALLARFRTEAEAVARLQHPHIVQIFEVGTHEGQPYCVLELVEGGTLAQRLGGTPLASAAAAAVVQILAEAMPAAHRHGIVHRDLKPSNVLLTPATGPEWGQPKITDFGLAKLLDGDGPVTQSGDVLGTPSYLAPEQARSGTLRVTPLADVYALGAILYEMLTDRPPFKGENAVETVLQVLHQEPVSPAQLQPRLPADLVTICLQCLRKEPGKRYADALALAEDLRRFRLGEPIRARPVRAPERLVRWARRRPVVAGLLLALTLAVTAGATGVLWQWGEAVQARRQAEANERTANHFAEEEKQARTAAEQAREGEQHQRRQVQEAFARTALNQAVSLCEQGDIDRGVLWLVHALDLAVKSGSSPLERAARLELGAWRPMLHGLEHVVAADNPVRVAVFHPSGRTFTAGLGGDFTHWAERRLLDGETETGRLLLPRRSEPRPTELSWLLSHPNGGMIYSGKGELVWRDWTVKPPVIPLEGRLIRRAALSPDGATLALVSNDRNLRLYDVSNGNTRGIPVGLPWEAAALLFKPDGTAVVAIGGQPSQPGEGLSFDARTGKPTGQRLRLGRYPMAAAFSPDSKILVTGHAASTAYLWSPGGASLGPPLQHTGSVTAVAWHKDSRVLATASLDRTVRLWQLTWPVPPSANAKPVVMPIGAPLRHQDRVTTVQFSPDGTRVLTGGLDNTIRLWQPGRAEPDRLVVQAAPSPNTRYALSDDGRLFFPYSLEPGPGVCQVFDTTGKAVGPAWDASLPGMNAAFSPDNRLLAVASRLPQNDENEVRLWQVGTGQPVGGPIRIGRVTWLSFGPDSRTLLCFKTRAALLIDSSGRARAELPLEGSPSSSSWGPDGARVTTLSSDGVQTWDVASGKLSWLKRGSQGISSAYSPDGKWLATGHEDGTARLWDPATGQERAVLTHALPVKRVVFHPRGGELLTLTSDLTQLSGSEMRLWRLTGTGAEPIGMPRSSTAAFLRALYHPDGESVVILTGDGGVRVWDTATGHPLGPALKTPETERPTVTFTPDGQALLLGHPGMGVVR